jgi:cytochrome c peroxidase
MEGFLTALPKIGRELEKERLTMKDTIALFSIGLLVLFLSVGVGEGPRSPAALSPLEELGKRLFFDINLSTPPGQECAVCHALNVGMTGPDEEINKKGSVYEGAVRGRFSNRKPPTAAYAGDSPVLHIDEEGNFVGGMFWDGRATGESLGDPLAEQAMGPFLNPVEQNMPDKKSVVLKVQESSNAALFEKVWGKGSLDAEKDVDGAFERIARSIAAYERSSEVNPFNSKFDDFWRKAEAAGLDVASIDESNWKKYENLGFDQVELHGLVLFNGQGMCSACHVFTSVDGKPPLFTDFTYDNLGIPKNPDNPFYKMPKEFNPDGMDWVDEGLGGFLKGTGKYAEYAPENIGKHKVPTLRNVALRPRPDFAKAYMHNGYFKSLKDIVHFYNTRDVASEKWPAPEVAVNINVDEMGDLELTAEEEDAIVAFMKTLSDKI